MEHIIKITESGMLMYEIIFYDTEDGKCPVQEFLDSLKQKKKKKKYKADYERRYGNE